MASIAMVVGTRPEIIKMAPVVRALRAKSLDVVLIHSGQHYEVELSERFIEELRLPAPKFKLRIKRADQAVQVGEMTIGLSRALRSVRPGLVLVQGDTNTTLAATLASIKLGLPVGHVEAGLRSHDWRMPEEHNRIVVDHLSELLFAPTELALRNLIAERVHGRACVTGNTIVDAVLQEMPVAEKRSKIMEEVRFDEYALVTVHRAENVDDPLTLRSLVTAFLNSPIPIVFPVHPRTENRLREFGLYDRLAQASHVQLMPPVSYLDMLVLLKNCVLVMTDSGGLQEEATVPCIRKPVLVLRASTERPEAIEAGFAKLVGVNAEGILSHLKALLEEMPELPSESPFGDGRSGERIAEESARFLEARRTNAF